MLGAKLFEFCKIWELNSEDLEIGCEITSAMNFIFAIYNIPHDGYITAEVLAGIEKLMDFRS
jgi:hypothetical protein